jgi:hypothetical protein
MAGLEPTNADATPGLSPQGASGGPLSFDVDLSGKILDAGNGVTARVVSGFLSFKPSIDVGISIKNWKINEVRAIANGAFTSDLQVELEGAWAIQESKEVTLWTSPSLRIPLPPIGIIPVSCQGTLSVKAGFQCLISGRNPSPSVEA